MTLSEIFGARLRRARLALGWSQEALAHAVGHKQPWVQRLESGARNIGHEDLVRLADELGVTLDWLSGRSEDGGPPAEAA